ncbi:MAG: hypothetical protein HKN22_06550 [Bacteroidia bacterium]|nr:hypothetical protein [Bacteroidia bacterium]
MYKSKIAGLIFFLLVIIPIQINAQDKFLALEIPGRVSRVKFPIGAEINVKIKGDNFFTRQMIEDLYDSTIVLSEKYISIADIAAIRYHSDNVLVRNLAYKFPVAAILILGLSAANYNADIDDRNKVLFTENSVIAASALMSVGIIGNIIMRKNVKIKGKTRLMILDTRITVD